MTGPDDAGLDGQRRMWTIGDYPAIARHLRPISLQVLDTVGVTAGSGCSTSAWAMATRRSRPPPGAH